MSEINNENQMEGKNDKTLISRAELISVLVLI